MKDADYIYAVARIRAKEKSLLSDGDVQVMTGLPDAAAVIQYLKDRGWGNRDTSSSEELLSAEDVKTRELIRELKVDQRILDVLGFPQIYHNLKTAIKQVCTGHQDSLAYYGDPVYDQRYFEEIIRDNRFEALPEHMQKAAAYAKEIMLTTRDGQRCDSIVDRACLAAMHQEAKASKDAFLMQYVEARLVSMNIKIAVRACDTGKSLPLIEEALGPCESLPVKELARHAAISREEIYVFLEKKGYGEAVAAMKESFSAFERWCDNHLMDTMLPEKHHIMSSGPVVAYYLARQNEIQMVRIIITAKENGFSEQVITERMRKMYG